MPDFSLLLLETQLIVGLLMVPMGGVTVIISHYNLHLEGIQVDTSYHLDFPVLQNDFDFIVAWRCIYRHTSKNKSVVIVLNVLGKCLWLF